MKWLRRNVFTKTCPHRLSRSALGRTCTTLSGWRIPPVPPPRRSFLTGRGLLGSPWLFLLSRLAYMWSGEHPWLRCKRKHKARRNSVREEVSLRFYIGHQGKGVSRRSNNKRRYENAANLSLDQ